MVVPLLEAPAVGGSPVLCDGDSFWQRRYLRIGRGNDSAALARRISGLRRVTLWDDTDSAQWPM
jgi:hypothetical protein